MTTRALLVVLFAFVLGAPAIARADEPAGRRPSPDVNDYMTALHDAESALSSSDCASACKALGSLRRATEKICALVGPGAQCDRAKAKADEVAKRVREACPDCAIAFAPTPDVKNPVSEPPKPGPPPADAQTTATGSNNPPAPAKSDSGRGGCASCDVTGAATSVDPSWIALVLWAISRRRKKSIAAP